MDHRKLKVWVPLMVSVAMVAGMWLGFKMRDAMPGRSFFYMEKSTPVEEVLTLIKNKYVDKVNTAALSDTAIEAMLAHLDPHSQFIPADYLEQANEDIAGGFYGIGIEFNIFDDTLHVINVIENGPADKAGLKTGDKILAAGDSLISGKNRSSEAMRKILKGNKGSVLPLRVLRRDKEIRLSVERDIIPVSSIDAGYLLDDSTGFIRLNKFSQKTYREFMETLEGLLAKGMKRLVLDLRGNGGGVLDEAVEIADEFLSGDKLITYTEGQHVERKEYRCRRPGLFEEGKLVVLADESTASASEILMGALQDWDRATIVGRRTFGKGLVQEQYSLSNGSALRLTVSRYYTPLGRSIQRSYTEGNLAYYKEITHRLLDTAAFVQPADAKSFTTKSGKKVYGGGGITPDVFTGIDTGRLGMVISSIYSKGIINDFGYRYYVEHPELSSQYKKPVEFVKGFSIQGEPWRFFLSMASKDSLDLSDLQLSDKEFLSRYLKLSVARQLWRNEGYYEVLNQEDDALRKALEILNKK